MLIETQHKRIPWRWVFLMAMIGLPLGFGSFAGGNTTFTMRKHIESPALINALSSLDVLFNILVGATCLYLSDRVWVRGLGRRAPFIIASWTVMGLALLFMPFATGVWMLVPLIILYYGFQDAGSTWEVLKYEVVPPEQRGRYSAMQQWFFQAFLMFFMVVMAGRFDETVERGPLTVKGEVGIYWIGGFSLLLGALGVYFFIRERRPPGGEKHESGAMHPGHLWRNLVREKKLWPVYLLAFSTSLTSTGLGAIDGLLVTEQWGYSYQELGTNIFVGGVINLFFIPVVGWLVDRFNRIVMFAIGVVGSTLAQIAYYVFIQFVLPEQRPEIWHMIAFGQVMSMFGVVSTTTLAPLIFDYIPRDAMGTAQAGMNLVRSITRFVTLNGVGLWVTWWTLMFSPGRNDYLSGYVFMIVMDFVGFAFLGWFILRVRRGEIRPLGREGLVTHDTAPAPVPPSTT